MLFLMICSFMKTSFNYASRECTDIGMNVVNSLFSVSVIKLSFFKPKSKAMTCRLYNTHLESARHS